MFLGGNFPQSNLSRVFADFLPPSPSAGRVLKAQKLNQSYSRSFLMKHVTTMAQARAEGGVPPMISPALSLGSSSLTGSPDANLPSTPKKKKRKIVVITFDVKLQMFFEEVDLVFRASDRQ